MNIVFVYSDTGYSNNRKFAIGIAQLLAVLKEEGHNVNFIHISNDMSNEEFIYNVKKYPSDIIAFSTISHMFPQIQRLASEVKKKLKVFTICGGVHPTLSPETVIESEGVDCLCVGEGEDALLELCYKLERGVDFTSIKNIWVKKEKKIVRNEVRPLIENLDKLPFADRELFRYDTLSDAIDFKRIVVSASRGCPYDCTYCCNHKLRELYPNSAKWNRFRSVNNLIKEILEVKEKYPFLSQVRFVDDTLSIKKEWFLEFCDKYKKEVGLPYSCNDRVNQISETVIKNYKESGCIRIDMGIESGNDYIRNNIMERRIKEEQIINAYSICRKYKINTSAFNILGIPYENANNVLDTIKLNAKIKPNKVFIFYFHPFIGTKLHKLVTKNNLFKNNNFTSIFEGPTLKLDTITENQQIFFYRSFHMLVSIYSRFYKEGNRFNKKIICFIDKIILSKCISSFANLYFQFRDFIYPILRKIKRRIKTSI